MKSSLGTRLLSTHPGQNSQIRYCGWALMCLVATSWNWRSDNLDYAVKCIIILNSEVISSSQFVSAPCRYFVFLSATAVIQPEGNSVDSILMPSQPLTCCFVLTCLTYMHMYCTCIVRTNFSEWVQNLFREKPSLGPRPKTNVDRFQYRARGRKGRFSCALYWKRYMRRMRSGDETRRNQFRGIQIKLGRRWGLLSHANTYVYIPL